MGLIKNSRKLVTASLRKEFQERFLAYLKMTGLKQTYIADRMHWSKQQIHQLGVGRAMPTITTLHVLASVMGVAPDRLFPTGDGTGNWRKNLEFDRNHRFMKDRYFKPLVFKKAGDV